MAQKMKQQDIRHETQDLMKKLCAIFSYKPNCWECQLMKSRSISYSPTTVSSSLYPDLLKNKATDK